MQVKYIPDCFYHSKGSGLFPSHEAICVINDHTEPVNLRITLYFEDRDKLDGFTVQVAAERTLHIRMDKLRNDCGQGVPMDVPYAAKIEVDKEVVMQYSRMDTSQEAMSICTTMV